MKNDRYQCEGVFFDSKEKALEHSTNIFKKSGVYAGVQLFNPGEKQTDIVLTYSQRSLMWAKIKNGIDNRRCAR